MQPCTLDAYAEKTKLPVGFLRKLNLSDMSYMGTPAVRIPYLKEDGGEGRVRFRVTLGKSAEGDDRFRWRKGSKPCLYGIWRLKQAREAGYVFLVEGESDCHTLWYYGFPALGVPGASNWRNEWASELDGIEKAYAVVEPDQGAKPSGSGSRHHPSERSSIALSWRCPMGRLRTLASYIFGTRRGSGIFLSVLTRGPCPSWT